MTTLNPLAPAVYVGAEITNHRGSSTVSYFQHTSSQDINNAGSELNEALHRTDAALADGWAASKPLVSSSVEVRDDNVPAPCPRQSTMHRWLQRYSLLLIVLQASQFNVQIHN